MDIKEKCEQPQFQMIGIEAVRLKIGGFKACIIWDYSNQLAGWGGNPAAKKIANGNW
ncbi:hypothetical protein [Bacillus salipaludis]|uniref:Bacteriocin n=1 Tax=Bacillus salipaludis TaxID=2547811 RepID=A0ABW8RAF3_9BACI